MDRTELTLDAPSPTHPPQHKSKHVMHGSNYRHHPPPHQHNSSQIKIPTPKSGHRPASALGGAGRLGRGALPLRHRPPELARRRRLPAAAPHALAVGGLCLCCVVGLCRVWWACLRSQPVGRSVGRPATAQNKPNLLGRHTYIHAQNRALNAYADLLGDWDRRERCVLALTLL